MANKSRVIRPSTWESFSLGRVSRDARLLFIALWTIADDEGRLVDSTKAIAGDAFRFDKDVTEKVVDRWLEELVSVGSIVRYEVDGKRCIAIPSWHRWQRPPHAKESLLPPPPFMNEGEGCHDNDRSEGGSESERSAPGFGFGLGSGSGPPFGEEFDALWVEYPRKVGKLDAYAKYKATRKRGVSAEELAQAVAGYVAKIKRDRTEQDFILHPATFFGPRERWRDFLKVKTAPARPAPKGETPEEFDRRKAAEQAEAEAWAASVAAGEIQGFCGDCGKPTNCLPCPHCSGHTEEDHA